MEEAYLTYPYPDYSKRKPLFQEGVLYIPEYYPVLDQYEDTDFDLSQHTATKERVVVEFCSGTGDWIVGCADKNRNVLYVAVERKFKRVCKIASKRDQLGLDNLLIVCGDAELFVKYFVKEPVFTQAYVNFPDPWPKKRHAKHRLFSNEFVADLSKTLIEGASLLLVTDDYHFVQHAKTSMLASKAWDYTLLESEDISSYGESYFHQLWLSKGRSIYFNQFDYLGGVTPEAQGQLTCLDVNLNSPKFKAKKTVGKASIIWCFDLQLTQKPIALSWEAYAQNISVKIKKALEGLSEELLEKTYGFSLFKGALTLPLISQEASSLQGFKEAHDENHPIFDTFNHFSLYLFAQLMHQFVPLFPEDKALFVLFSHIDKVLTLTQVLAFTSQELFPYIQCALPPSWASQAVFYKNTVTLQEAHIAKKGVVLPKVSELNKTCAMLLDSVFEKLIDSQLPFKVISECVLNEAWEGLEKLIIIDKTLSNMGRRMLKGFELGGGDVTVMSNEKSLLSVK